VGLSIYLRDLQEFGHAFSIFQAMLFADFEFLKLAGLSLLTGSYPMFSNIQVLYLHHDFSFSKLAGCLVCPAMAFFLPRLSPKVSKTL
jgi:hypothetical protein